MALLLCFVSSVFGSNVLGALEQQRPGRCGFISLDLICVRRIRSTMCIVVDPHVILCATE